MNPQSTTYAPTAASNAWDAPANPIASPPSAAAPAPAPKTGLLTPGRLALMVVLAYVPMLIVYGQVLWLKPHYQFFPVLAGAAAWLAWARFQELPEPLASGGPALGGYIVLASLALLAVGSLLFSPWVCVVSLWFALAGLALWLGGSRLLKAMAGPLALLLVIVPPPNNLDEDLVGKMQNLAVTASSRILDKMKVTHLVAGNVLELPTKRLLVEEACSGINSLLSVAAFTLCYAIWMRRGVIHTILLLGFAFLFVLALNIIRISLGAVLEFRIQYNILTGWRHETAGLILFAVALGLVLSLDQLLRFPADALRAWRNGILFGLPLEARLEGEDASLTQLDQAEKAKSEAPALAAAPSKGLARPWRPTRLAWFAALGFAIMLAANSARVGATYVRRAMTGDARQQFVNLREISKFQLPAELAGWKLVEGEAVPVERSRTIGQFSKTWHYSLGRLQAAVAVDSPFPGWHELPACYQSNGWTLRSREPVNVSGLTCVESAMTNALAVKGHLFWGIADAKGQWLVPDERKLEPVETASNAGFLNAVYRRVLKPLEDGFRPDFDTYETGRPAHYQIQTFLPSFGYGDLTPAERKALFNLYQAAGTELARQIREAS